MLLQEDTYRELLTATEQLAKDCKSNQEKLAKYGQGAGNDANKVAAYELDMFKASEARARLTKSAKRRMSMK